MRKFLLYFLFVIPFSLQSQFSITDAEFFWGLNDPGQGNGTPMVVVDGNFNEVIEEIIKNNVSPPTQLGLSLLNIRVKDGNNNWGPLYKRAINLEDYSRDLKITSAEFFWGLNDPGQGSGTTMIVFDGNYNEAVEVVVSNNVNPPSSFGLSLLNIRVRDENNVWGPLYKRAINLEDYSRNLKITSAEFFWGLNDPGQGSGTTMIVFDGNFNEAVEVVVSNNVNPPSSFGLSLLNIRVRDENNIWGPLYKRSINLEDYSRDIKITSAEFFWGLNDPGQGSGTTMIVFDGNYNEAVEVVVSNSVNPPSSFGLSLLNIRVRDEDNVWGPIYKRALNLEDYSRDIKITAVEFFWGLNDPGEGNGTIILVFDGNFDEAIEQTFYSNLVLPNIYGLNLLNIRVKDEDGVWGPLYKRCIRSLYENFLPEITSNPILTIPIFDFYEYTITSIDSNQNTLFYFADTIPNWLTINDLGNDTAILSGTPTTIGTYNISLYVTDTLGGVEYQNFSVNVVCDTSYSYDTIISCDVYNWNGNSYNSSGIYSDTLISSYGCDSIISLDLTIINVSSSFDTITSCDDYLWNGALYNSSGDYVDTLQNINGCDSIVNFNLTIIPSTTDFNYSGNTVFCQNDSNPVAVITGASGGLFTSSSGLLINSLTGEIDLDSSLFGTYDVTYMPPTIWQQVGQDLEGEASSDYFGSSVSLSADGNILAVGAYQNDGANGVNSGHVRVFKKINGNWIQLGNDIDGEDINDASGYSVSLNYNGNIIAIGATSNNSNAGHVRVFQWNGTSWVQLGNDIDGEAAGDYSGQSVSMNASGHILAIGARENDGNGPDAGHVRVFQWDGNSWLQRGNDIEGDQAFDDFGYSVSMNSNGLRIAVGAPHHQGSGVNSGHVKIYDWNGTSWIQLGNDINGEAAGDECGRSVSLNGDGNRIAIGARFNDGVNGPNSGHVRIFEYSSGSWFQIGQDVDGESSGDSFGTSVKLNLLGDKFVAGANSNDGNGSNSGHTRVFQNFGGNWYQIGDDIEGTAAGDENGFSVTSDSTGSIIATGARKFDGTNGIFNMLNAGHVRVFGVNSVTCPKPLTITINPVLIGDTIIISDCDSTNWLGNTYTSSGIYNDTLVSSVGCDSIVTLVLTILNSSSLSYDTITSCDDYQWNGTVYNFSGDYVDTLQNINGCDSIVNLNLAIIPSTTDFNYSGNTVFCQNDSNPVPIITGASGGMFTSSSGLVINSVSGEIDLDSSLFGTYNVTYTPPSSSFGGNWNQLGFDIDGDSINDESGKSVDINYDGSRIVVGATQFFDPDDYGYAYVYEYRNGNWYRLGNRITEWAGGALTGFSVSINGVGDVVAIGHLKYYDPIVGNKPGMVSVYEFNGTNWMKKGSNLLGESNNDEFGCSVSLNHNGNVLAVGAQLNGGNGPSSGHVRVFEFINGNWIQIGNDIDGENPGDNSGMSVSLNKNGDILAVGDWWNDENGNQSGQSRVFKNIGGNWIQIGSDLNGEALEDFFGISVDLNGNGNILVVGAHGNDGNGFTSGHARVFKFENNNWNQIGNDIDGDVLSQSGRSVSLNDLGNIVAIGAHQDNGATGKVKIYENISNNWVQLGSDLVGEDANNYFGFASSISKNGNRLVVGAYENDGNGFDAGHARVFGYSSLVCTQPLTITINPTVSGDTTIISDCDSTNWLGNTYTSSGIYNDTLVSSNGCDSVVTMDLTIHYSIATTDNLISCDSAIWNGNVYNTSGIYVDTLQTIYGCDSVVTIDLTINNSTQSTDSLVACDSAIWNGNVYNTSGIYVDTLQTIQGCDSVVTMDLTINNSTQSTDSLVACDSAIWNGNIYMSTGIYVDTLQTIQGCDSVVIMDLTIHNSVATTDNLISCDSAIWNGNVYDTSGIYVDTLQTINGCDSVVIMDLTIHNSVATTYNLISCDSAIWNGNVYTSTGIYVDTLQTIQGCDSVVTMDLTINNSSQFTDSLVACDSTIWNGNIYTSSGIYVDTLQNIDGCDSVVTMNLTIHSSVATSDNLISCDSAIWNGNVYTSTGIYIDTLLTILGCDSIVAMDITLNYSVSTSDSIEACNSYNWNGVVYTATGQYVDTLQTASGCDSIVTLSLSLSDSYQIIENITSCDNYNWNGVVYSATGQYVDSLQSISGCDSIRVLNLIINQSTSNLSTISSCNYYVWNNDTLSSSGTYIDTSTNSTGCIHIDSLILTINGTGNSTYQISCNSYNWNGIDYYSSGTYLSSNGNCTDTLYLTILESDTSITNVSSCGSYLWNGVEYYNSGQYNQLLQTVSACDSNLVLNLNILEETYSSLSISSCGSYDFNGSILTSSGIYIDSSINSNGCVHIDSLSLTITNTGGSTNLTNCDSLVWNGTTYANSGTYYTTGNCVDTLNLVINSSDQSIDNITSCDSYTWIDGITYNYENTTSTVFLTNSVGCDSVVTLNLTINTSEVNSEVLSVCDSYNWNGTTYTNSGQYVDTLQTNSGCDSIVTLKLLVSSNIVYVDTIFGCDSLEINGVNYTSSFDYTDTLQTIDGCDSIVSLNININYSEQLNNIDTICSYELPYEWDGFVFDTTGLQTLTLNTLNGCDSTINYFLYTIECDDQIFSINIPNVFTPNGDGENDVFEITGTHFDVVEFYIYNRWNSLLFFTDRNIGWRGRNYVGAPVPDGTYYYIIKIKKYEDYNKSNFTIENYKGSLMLVGSNN